MLLQEIFKDGYSGFKEIYGISINEKSSDTEYSNPPKNFEVIGFNLVLDEEGLISEELLDIIISYKLTNMTIVIEVPSQLLHNENITAKKLIQLATNVDFSISILPPGHPLVNNAITHEEYLSVIANFIKEMNNKPNFDKFVAPISNFLEYLMLETLLGKEHPVVKKFSPQDYYIKEIFLNHMTEKESDDFKDVIREELYNFYGGEEQFKAVSSVIFEGIYNKTKETFTEHLNNYYQAQQENEKNKALENEKDNESKDQ